MEPDGQRDSEPYRLCRLSRCRDNGFTHIATCSCRGICTTRSRYNQGYSPRDAFAGMCTVPRRILLQRRRQISDIPLGQGLYYGRRRALLRRSRLLRLYTYSQPHSYTQGTTSRLRDSTAGHTRTERRIVCRLPYAIQERGRSEIQRPPHYQPIG